VSRFALCLILLLALTGGASAAPTPNVIFARVKWLNAVQFYGHREDDSTLILERANFLIIDDFMGNIDKKNIEAYVFFTMPPESEHSKNLIIFGNKNQEIGNIVNIWWYDLPFDCIHKDEAADFGILDKLIALRETRRIRPSFACDW
jgi:hypothetical protein